MIIDSHQHFWQLSQPFDYGWLTEPQHQPICRDYLPADLKPHLDSVGIDRTVLVQTQHDLQETRWALQLAEENDFIAGVVGWINLRSEACEDPLLEFKSQPKFVGIRHIVQDEPDENFIIRPDFLRGLKVLEKHQVPYDILTYPQHLKHAAILGRELPELPMVIDHLSKPKIKAGLFEDWNTELKAAAQFPNIVCKLSGMVTEADWQNWKPADLKPYVETALEAFGPERCMFGSDWPVLELAGTYEQIHQALTEVLGPISDTERDQIFGRTAEAFYRLNL
jgi:L-fuconolactonase